MKTNNFYMILSLLLLFCYTNLIGASDVDLFASGRYQQILLPRGLGPESIAFDCRGDGPYVGVSDGRILKWQNRSWSEFAIPSANRNRVLCDGTTNPNLEPICGRPLGLKFNPATCDLYIADAYFGLLVVGPNGGIARHLVNSAEGVPFRLTNALDIDEQTGAVYFTDSSAIYQRRQYILSFNTRERTGRILKYDPKINQVSVIGRGLAFPNGVALSKDKSFLLVAEGGTRRILKLQLNQLFSTPQFFRQLIRSPDNVKRNQDGHFWVALNSGRTFTNIVPNRFQDPIGIKLDQDGRILQILNGYGSNQLNSVSEVEEHGGNFYLGSAVKPFVGVLRV
ncbi:hypothetical protein ACFE04_010977 [Oxalis oulophora]